MSSSKDICVVCAWRIDCQKKFSISGRDIRCPDFVRDLLLDAKHKAQKNEQKKLDKT